MANLILLGNGFDLAHGMKTSYRDFIEHFFEKCRKDPNFSHQLIDINDHVFDLTELFYRIYHNDNEIGCSWLLEEIARDYKNKNWCDIEHKYFEFISSLEKWKTQLPPENTSKGERFDKNKYNIKLLNEHFSVVKKHLEDYLSNLPDPQAISLFEKFFRFLSDLDADNLYVNFNYTGVLEKQYHLEENTTIHLHGELGNENNKMIFGIANDQKSLSTLLEKNDNAYLENVKRYQYKMSDNEEILWRFLHKHEGSINLFVLGLSCGISDKYILNEIFTHPNIHRINLFYYKDEKNYQDLIRNIDRLIDADPIIFKKISKYKYSCRTPQWNDSGGLTEIAVHQIGEMLKHITSNLPQKERKSNYSQAGLVLVKKE